MENNLPKRKPTRLEDFAYSENGAYFITICTENRKNILSAIKPDCNAVGEGFPLPHLSQYGVITDSWIQKIPVEYPEISVDCYVIMPNHIHLLLSVSQENGRGDPSPTIVSVIGWIKYQATAEINRLRGVTGEKVFRRSFYDHVVRNRNDYNEIYKYIEQNPLRWQLDKLYAED